MRTKRVIGIFIILSSLVFTSLLVAQDNLRVRPAFPIGAGEKMIVWPGARIVGSEWRDPVTWTQTNATTRGIIIELPVGITLKRILGDFVDQSGSANMTIRLIRYANNDTSTSIILREFNTSGISSSSATDFKQVVSNPLSHSMLQGWNYYVTVEWPGGTSADELILGTLKLVYEP